MQMKRETHVTVALHFLAELEWPLLFYLVYFIHIIKETDFDIVSFLFPFSFLILMQSTEFIETC